jgi:hypothetical protein
LAIDSGQLNVVRLLLHTGAKLSEQEKKVKS